MNLLTKLTDIMSTGLPQFTTKRVHNQKSVGGGYWALRGNTSRGGISYTKLVIADQSGPVSGLLRTNHIPSVGHRTDRPATRRARRNVPIS